jgi:ElaB/YqjD/DUF883 family membrane-anchored ribosome-binding protein
LREKPLESKEKTMRFRRRNGSDVGKHLSACRDDLVALQRDARELASEVTEVTKNGANRAVKQASDAYGYVSNRLNGRPVVNMAAVQRAAHDRRLTIVAFFAGAGAVIGALLTRR